MYGKLLYSTVFRLGELIGTNSELNGPLYRSDEPKGPGRPRVSGLRSSASRAYVPRTIGRGVGCTGRGRGDVGALNLDADPIWRFETCGHLGQAVHLTSYCFVVAENHLG